MIVQCTICQRKYNENAMLQSDLDEYFCKECFKYQYTTACKKKKNRTLYAGDSPTSGPKKMFSPLDLVLLEKGRHFHDGSVSKRPLQCPHPNCNRYVSIFDLNAHFQYEHTDITQDTVLLDMRKSTKFDAKNMQSGIKTCLLLLSIKLPPPIEIEKNADNDPSPANQAEAIAMPPIAVVVLASRIIVSPLTEHDELCFNGDEEMLLYSNEKLVFWLASNINTNLSYTVAASTPRGDIRVKYYGPMPQMSNTPMQIYKEGHGLVLNHYQFAGMTENGLKDLTLDVIVHSED